MKFNLRFLAGFERQTLQFSDDLFWENVVQKLFVGHFMRVSDL